MSVHQNSIEAYNCDKMDSNHIKDSLMAYSVTVPHFTDVMAGKAIGKAPSTVSSKRRELVNEGRLVKELDKHPCDVTTNSAMWFYNPKRQIGLIKDST